MLLVLLLAVTAPLKTQTWDVDGVQRTAIVQAPSGAYGSNHSPVLRSKTELQAKTDSQANSQPRANPFVKTAEPKPIVGSQQQREAREASEGGLRADTGAPLVFVFHGHGGTGLNMARKDFSDQWPEAFFVFPQGLNTKSYYDPEGKRTGWQNQVASYDDRDLKFFDAMLTTMLAKGVDPNRVYATGHSNGGYFSYLLWAERRDKLAAIASSAGGGVDTLKLQPLPAMHLAGQQDPIVRFTVQQRCMELARKVNRCVDEPEPLEKIGLEYPSTLDTPFVEYIHPGGHEFLRDAPQRIVAFFQRHTRPDEGYPTVEPVPLGERLDRFSQLDENGDGEIDKDELQRPFLFRVLDKDGDGVITRAEANSVLGKL